MVEVVAEVEAAGSLAFPYRVGKLSTRTEYSLRGAYPTLVFEVPEVTAAVAAEVPAKVISKAVAETAKEVDAKFTS